MSEGALPELSLKSREKYNKVPITEHLCRSLGVADPAQILPFGDDFICAYETMRKSVFSFELTSDISIDLSDTKAVHKLNVDYTERLRKMATPPEPFTYKGKSFPHNLAAVSISAVTCKGHAYTNLENDDSLPTTKCSGQQSTKDSLLPNLAIRLNYYHDAWSGLQETKEHDALYEVMGGVRGAFGILQPTGAEGCDKPIIAMPDLDFGYTCQQFIRTMSHINEKNLMTGIIEIPHQICLEAKLSVWKGVVEPTEEDLVKMMGGMKIDPNSEEGKQQRNNMIGQYKAQLEQMTATEDACPSHFWAAIPVNHILAWGYHSESLRNSCGHRVEEYRFVSADGSQSGTIYYLVPEALLINIVKTTREQWIGKVDKRPLKSFGFELIPMLESGRTGIIDAHVSLSVMITMYTSPNLGPQTIDNLVPVLSRGFPPAAKWSSDEFDKHKALEEFTQSAVGQVRQGRRLNK